MSIEETVYIYVKYTTAKYGRITGDCNLHGNGAGGEESGYYQKPVRPDKIGSCYIKQKAPATPAARR